MNTALAVRTETSTSTRAPADVEMDEIRAELAQALEHIEQLPHLHPNS